MNFSFIFLATAEAVAVGGEFGFLGTLGVDWKLFLAQLVNFGIVVFILWRWVMKPVVGALESRRQKIEKSVKDAEEIEKRVREFQAHKEQELSKARAEALNILQKATGAAAAVKKETLVLAQKEANRILEETKRAVEEEKQRLLRELREEIATLTIMATEKVLREKLSGQKDQELVRQAVKNLRS